jgi:hypothetical protein
MISFSHYCTTPTALFACRPAIIAIPASQHPSISLLVEEEEEEKGGRKEVRSGGLRSKGVGWSGCQDSHIQYPIQYFWQAAS